MGTLVSLDRVRNEEDGALYPRDRLTGLSTALMGFCAGFGGRQDCVWVADAGLDAVCVDISQELLDDMAPMYPDAWRFVQADVFEWAPRRYAEGVRYDVVSLDPPTNLFGRVANTLELWCSLARVMVVFGTGPDDVVVPYGWQPVLKRRRSTFRGGTYWTTLEPVR